MGKFDLSLKDMEYGLQDDLCGIFTELDRTTEEEAYMLLEEGPDNFVKDPPATATSTTRHGKGKELKLLRQVLHKPSPSPKLPSAKLPSPKLPSAKLPSPKLPSSKLPSPKLPSPILPSLNISSTKLPSSKLPSPKLPSSNLPSRKLPPQKIPLPKPGCESYKDKLEGSKRKLEERYEEHKNARRKIVLVDIKDLPPVPQKGCATQRKRKELRRTTQFIGKT